jgi:hypothetical protein
MVHAEPGTASFAESYCRQLCATCCRTYITVHRSSFWADELLDLVFRSPLVSGRQNPGRYRAGYGGRLLGFIEATSGYTAIGRSRQGVSLVTSRPPVARPPVRYRSATSPPPRPCRRGREVDREFERAGQPPGRSRLGRRLDVFSGAIVGTPYPRARKLLRGSQFAVAVYSRGSRQGTRGTRQSRRDYLDTHGCEACGKRNRVERRLALGLHTR